MNMTSNNTSNRDPKTEILGKERRRRWSPSEKQSVVSETYQPGFTVSQVARKYGIPPSQLFYWRRRLEEGALVAVGSEEKVIPESEVKALKERIRNLERLLGKKTEQVEILREAIELAREKKLISRQPLPGVDDIPFAPYVKPSK
jgi:transposase